MKILILAVGKLRGDEASWCDEYVKRLKGQVTVKELSTGTQKTENEHILKALPDKGVIILCDERGKDLSSRDFAAKIEKWQETASNLTFIIGGADGVTDAVRQRAAFILGFGKATWPHRLVRIMLLEQLYRAQQINAGHPYHRD